MAGWYPDPLDRHERRFWDGASWTERVRDGRAERADTALPPMPDWRAASAQCAYGHANPSGRRVCAECGAPLMRAERTRGETSAPSANGNGSAGAAARPRRHRLFGRLGSRRRSRRG